MNTDQSKEKAKNALPLKKTFLSSNENEAVTTDHLRNESFSIANAEEFIGTRRERKDCAIGVRVTRHMKEIIEAISSKTRLSESEVVFRILKNNLNLD